MVAVRLTCLGNRPHSTLKMLRINPEQLNPEEIYPLGEVSPRAGMSFYPEVDWTTHKVPRKVISPSYSWEIRFFNARVQLCSGFVHMPIERNMRGGRTYNRVV